MIRSSESAGGGKRDGECLVVKWGRDDIQSGSRPARQQTERSMESPHLDRCDGNHDMTAISCLSYAVRRSYAEPCRICGDTLSRSMWRGPWWDWCCTRCSEHEWRIGEAS